MRFGRSQKNSLKNKIENKYVKINKLILAGNKDKETLSQFNKNFKTNTTKEIYTRVK